MRVLREGESPRLAQALANAWSSDETFALLPAKSSVTAQYIQALLERLPERYRTKHFCMLTSGSTGVPNLVVGCRSRAEELASVLHNAQQNESVCETIVALPLAYCYAFINQWLWSLTHRCKLRMTLGLSDPVSFMRTLREARDGMLCLVGSQVPLLFDYAQSGQYPGVIRLHFAGGRFPQEHIGRLLELFPNSLIFNNYGCAEAMPRLTLRRSEEDDDATSVGRPIEGVTLSTSSDGSILFRSPYRIVARFVSQEFDEIDTDRWLPTGDKGRLLDDGQLSILGRSNQVFKRYGEKIAITQIIETVAREWDGQIASYRECDANGEDGYVLSLSPAPTAAELQGLLLGLRRRHSRPHWPLRIESVPDMPTLPNGKIDAGALHNLEECTTHWRQHI